MNPRLKRQLLTAVISGALVAGGAVSAAPAFAGTPVSAVGPVLADETSPATNEPTTEPTTPATTEPTTPATTEPTTPATTEPTTEPTTPATTEPTTEPTTTAPTTAPTSTKPDGAPTGSFRLNSFALWVGQAVTVTQLNVADDGVLDPANVSRLITWGDGTSTRIYKGWGAVGHKYARAGRFPITLTLADPAGHQTVLKTVGPLVTIPAVKYRLSATSVWTNQYFNIAISNVPSGTTKITLDEGDGYSTTLPGKNQTIRAYYSNRSNGALVRGPVTIRASYTNKFGTSSWFFAARPTVKVDSWKPVPKIKKPTNANRASSWKTVSGTVTDKGSGAALVHVSIQQNIRGKDYCFNKGWHPMKPAASFNKYCKYAFVVKTVNGKYSFKLGGVRKGMLWVDVKAEDYVGNVSGWADVAVKITK